MVAPLLLISLAHVASIATLEPHVGGHLGDAAHFWILAGQLPLMATTMVLHAELGAREQPTGLAQVALGLGLAYLTVLLLRNFDVLVGPANPLAAPADADDAVKIGWFAAFAGIMTIGNTAFIARPLLSISDAVLRPMRRLPMKARQGIMVAIGAGAGIGLAAFAASDAAAELAAKLNEVTAANPAAMVIGAIAVPMVLQAIKAAVGRGRGRGGSQPPQ